VRRRAPANEAGQRRPEAVAQDWNIEPLRSHTGPAGAVEWVGRTASYFWFGPGSGLWLSIGEDHTSCTRIEHPAADGSYDTRAQAQRAVSAFRAAAREDLQQPKSGRRRRLRCALT